MFGKRLALKTKVIKSYSYAHKRSKPNSNVEQTPYAINVDIHQGLCVGYWSNAGVAKRFGPRVEFATVWSLEGRIQCDLRDRCKDFGRPA